MEKVTPREVVAVGLKLVAVALFTGAVVLTGLEISVLMAIGAPQLERVAMIFLLFSVAPVFGAIVIWEAANHALRAGGSPIQ